MVISDEKNSLFVERVPVELIAKKFGTPVYVYSVRTIRNNIERLKAALQKNIKVYKIQYPVKANSNPHILKVICDSGLAADCSSPAEITIARKCGFPISGSTYTGNFESYGDLKAASDSGIIINLDDFRRLDDLIKIKKPELISFRINPGIGKGGFQGIVTGGENAKFGIPFEDTYEAYSFAVSRKIERFGIHMMTGSNVVDPEYFGRITDKLTTIAGEVFSKLKIKPEFINIGGGLGIPYKTEEAELDLDTTFKQVAAVLYKNIEKYDLGNPLLVVEPGRFLVGNAGVILTRVTHIKQSYKSFIGLDAGMNALVRPAMYGAFHRILINNSMEKVNKDNFYFTGQICENSDVHPEMRCISKPETGDLAVILDAGAYGFAMSSNYNNRPRPAEVLINGEEMRLIREAETEGDIFKNVPGFSLN